MRGHQALPAMKKGGMLVTSATSDSIEGYRDVASPLTAQMLAPLPPHCPGVSIIEPLNDGDYQKVAELLSESPDKELYISQLETPEWSSRPFVEHPITDLKFLRFSRACNDSLAICSIWNLLTACNI
ncbi:hypothetical protein [Mycolicibacterium fortuitum]|uniref:hypothetical protein n=1 Tax=Mycolicibacterium fortuitum TaxID=1766 RepID=UPI003AAC6670